MSKRVLASVAALVVLAACHGPAAGPKLPPALSSAVATGEALNAAGEAPQWSLQIRARGLVFSTAGGDAVTLPNDGPSSDGTGAIWSGTANGAPFRVRLTAVECSDAATGLRFPFTAEVDAGGTTYHGCAAAAGQGLGPRG